MSTIAEQLETERRQDLLLRTKVFNTYRGLQSKKEDPSISSTDKNKLILEATRTFRQYQNLGTILTKINEMQGDINNSAKLLSNATDIKNILNAEYTDLLKQLNKAFNDPANLNGKTLSDWYNTSCPQDKCKDILKKINIDLVSGDLKNDNTFTDLRSKFSIMNIPQAGGARYNNNQMIYW